MNQIIKRHKPFFVIITGVFIYFWWIVNQDLFVNTADESIYLEVAYNFLHGNGLVYLKDGNWYPYIFWPPLYPVLIALSAHFTNHDIMAASVLLRSITLLLTFVYLYRILLLFKIRRILVCAGLVFYWFSWTFFLSFSALSETLFIPLFLMSVYYFLRYTEQPKTGWLVKTAVFISLALLTRYAALGIIPAYLLTLLALRIDRTEKIKHISVFLLIVTAFFLPWYFYTLHFSKFFGRDYAFHFLGTEHFNQFFVTSVNWIVPGLTKFLIVPVGILGIWGIFLSRKEIYDRIGRIYAVTLLVIASVYVFFIIIVISFVDYSSPLDFRMLAPVYLIMLVLSLCILDIIYNRRRQLFYVLLGLLFISHTVNFISKTEEFLHRSQVNLSLAQTQFLKTIKSFDDRLIWCNVSDKLKQYVENDTLIMDFPVKYDSKSLKKNKSYLREMNEIKQIIRRNKGVIVYFKGHKQWDFSPGLDEIKEFFKEFNIMEFDEGIIITRQPLPAQTP